jgi:nicotinic acid mononucleotide adenylyltransferase
MASVVFTIGRMNPPTPGHMLLIEKLIYRAASLDQTKIGIILSHSQDLPKNPFTCEEKRKLLLSGMIQALKEQMKLKASSYSPPISPDSIDRIEPIIICMNDPTPPEFGGHPIIKSITTLLSNYGYPENPIENAFLIIGEDRALSYNWVVKNLAERKPPIHTELESLPRPPGAISATEIRGYAMSGDWPNFSAKMHSIGISEDALREVFDQLHEMLTAPAPVTKSKKGKKGGNKPKSKKCSKKTKKCGGNRRARKTKKIYKRRK